MSLLRLGTRIGMGRRRRRKGSIGVFILVLGGFFGVEYLRDEWQKREEYSGRIVRVYDEKPFYAKSSSSSRDYHWDVESADGTMHTLRILPKSRWNAAHSGDWIIKRAGELYPERVGGSTDARRRR